MNAGQGIETDGLSPEVAAVCALMAVPGVGASTLAAIRKAFGTAADAVQAGPRSILEHVKLQRRDSRDYLARGPNLVELGRWAVGAAKDAGARIIVRGDPDYPTLLNDAANPPPVLYVKGVLDDRPRIALVGSRAPDDEGAGLSRIFGEGIARSGVTVVSGGARGIDTCAHEGALAGGGSTIAVLGTGIDVVYPKENAALFERVARGGGAVVSELAPGTPPSASNFPRRNRTVAALCDALIVVRAAERSGALITARFAREYGRVVFAVPDETGNPSAAGCSALLANGALPAKSWTEALKALGIRAADAPEAPPTARAQPLREPRPAIAASDEIAAALWQLLDERTPVHVDELALRARIPAQETLRKLAELELEGVCVQRPGKYFLRARG